MARKILWSGSVTLPAPTSITVNDEIIWTSDTGRTYRGTLSKEQIGWLSDGIFYYKSASVDIVQR